VSERPPSNPSGEPAAHGEGDAPPILERTGTPASHGKIGQLLAGSGLLFEAWRLLRRERSLWPLALVPMVFSTCAVALALSLIFAYAGELYAGIEATLPAFDVSAWFQWIWLGPAKLAIWLLGYLVFALAAGLALVLALMLASVAAAPFLDALSQRAERLAAGEVVDMTGSGWTGLARDARRSLWSEVQRMSTFLAIWAVLFGAGFVIPGAHLITGPLLLGVTILFLPLEYSGYTLDRRQLSFRERRAWVSSHLPRMAGFGIAAFISCLVPGVNLMMIPVLVVAGTLLVLQTPPRSAAPLERGGSDPPRQPAPR
jgi:CysZ protein